MGIQFPSNNPFISSNLTFPRRFQSDRVSYLDNESLGISVRNSVCTTISDGLFVRYIHYGKSIRNFMRSSMNPPIDAS